MERLKPIALDAWEFFLGFVAAPITLATWELFAFMQIPVLFIYVAWYVGAEMERERWKSWIYGFQVQQQARGVYRYLVSTGQIQTKSQLLRDGTSPVLGLSKAKK